MPRIDLADIENASVEVRELYYFGETEGAPDGRMVLAYGHSPVGAALLRAWRTAHFGGVLPHRLKELVRIHLSVVEGCAYCSSTRSAQAVREGVTDDVLRELARFEESPVFSEREKAALRFGQQYRADAIDDDDVFADLRLHFTDEEVIELGVLCVLVEGGRFAKALQIMTWAEACELAPVLTEMTTSTA